MTNTQPIVEYFAFNSDGSLAFTCTTPNGFEADIEARSLTVVGSTENVDLDYTYTLVNGKIVSVHAPMQAPPELNE